MNNQPTPKESKSLFGEKIRVDSTSLNVKKDLVFKEWEHIGAFLQYVEGSMQWWRGDWLNYGERKFGEKYAQAIEVTGRSYYTLAQYAWVAEKFNPHERSQQLTWSHHLIIAGLEKKEDRTKLLRLAEKEKLSTKQLRQEVKKLKGTQNEEDRFSDKCEVMVKDKGVCERCSNMLHFVTQK